MALLQAEELVVEGVTPGSAVEMVAAGKGHLEANVQQQEAQKNQSINVEGS